MGSSGANAGAAAYPTARTATTDDTLVLGDAMNIVRINSATTKTVTVPPAASVAWVTNSRILVRRIGAGSVIIAAGAGVTISAPGSRLTIAEQYASCELIYSGSDVWYLDGDLIA
jgi:hypothetical protein